MSRNPRREDFIPGQVALCYVRLSYTRHGEHDISPQRQRENNLRICEQVGLTPELYEDVNGHRSGRHVDNRPGWQALEKRIGDPDVAAIVANDLSRLHRKGWRIGHLLEVLEQHHIRLVLSAPGRHIDTSEPQGRVFITFMAMADEYYAEDIAMRARASIARRKAKGITVGSPPFGTVRDETGYLMARSDGVWLLADGSWQPGTPSNRPPEAVAWRGYYDAAVQVLTHYATGQHGHRAVAELMNAEGWAFRGRGGHPRPFKRGDIRQIVGNVYTYGGIVQNAEG